MTQREIPFPFDRTLIVSTPSVSDDSYSRQVFCGMDFAAGPDESRSYMISLDGAGNVVGLVTLENAIDDERFMLFGDDPPSGHILVSGEPMAFWLPGDKTPAGIGLNTTEQAK